jgi:NAD(P)H-quinone oxidoreductase subunit 2
MNKVSLSGKSEAGSSPGKLMTEWILGLAVLVMFALLGWLALSPTALVNSGWMQFVHRNNLMLIGPEMLLSVVILACTLLVAFSKTHEERQKTWILAGLGSFFTLIVLALHYFLLYDNPAVQSHVVFGGILNADLLSLISRTLLVGATLLILLFSRYFVDQKLTVPGEFYILLLCALLGGMFLSMANDLIMVFVSLETLSISSYILVAYMRGNVASAEAGLKYLLYGSMATAILLFGFSILYGMTGSVNYAAIANALSMATPVHPLIVAIMTVMIVGGVSFKLSAAPFHMWAPDAYEGAPTPVVAFLSIVSKIAAFSFAIRFFYLLLGAMAGWMGLIAVLSVVSMVLGNVVALTQRNIKRLLAYSTVAHVGYLLLGLVVLTQDGLASLFYYLMAYLFMNLGAFAVVTYFENQTGSVAIADYAGLIRKRPWFTLVLSIMFLSLAGIPITAGFFGKFFLFQAVANAGSQHLWLVIIALLTSTISLYYYLNVIRLMVIQEPSEVVENLPASGPSLLSPLPAFSMAVCLIGTLALGVFAAPAMDLSRQAIAQMTGGTVTAAKPAPQHLSQAR